jgi:hypothetical protein
MALVQKLNFISQLMRANLIGLKEINILNISGHVELPKPIDLVSQALNWLISFCKVIGA